MHQAEGLHNPGRVGGGLLTALNGYTATRIFGRHGESRRGLVGHESEDWLVWSADTVEVEVEVKVKVKVRLRVRRKTDN